MIDPTMWEKSEIGEFLASPEAKAFLENLAQTKKYKERTALCLNLLMAELGLNIKFISL